MSCSGREGLESVVNVAAFQIAFNFSCDSIATFINDCCVVRIIINFYIEGVKKLVISLCVKIDLNGKHVVLLFPYPWELGNIELLRSRTS